MNQSQSAGFTLVELAIIIVIIGLVAAGLLVGKDLIKAAELRAQVAQIQEIETATQTFMNKYGGLPGDILASEAEGYGMEYRDGEEGNGDGDKYIETCDFSSYAGFGCEAALFWRDLSYAQLISGRFDKAVGDYIVVTEDQLDQYFPKAKIGQNNYITIFSDVPLADSSIGCYRNEFCFGMRQIKSTSAPFGQFVSEDKGITPFDAFSLDKKIDDGSSGTGRMVGGDYMPSFDEQERNGMRVYHGENTAFWDADRCNIRGANGVVNYDVAPPRGEIPSCAINFNF